MKQKKTMLIMVIVLAVLLALYGGLKAWNSHSEKQKKAKENKRWVGVRRVRLCLDRERGGWGKRVDLGGGRIL